MRSHLISLGLNRPTRIKDEDDDVPMLKLEDWEIRVFSPNEVITSIECNFLRDTSLQTGLVMMCIGSGPGTTVAQNVYQLIEAGNAAKVPEQGLCELNTSPSNRVKAALPVVDGFDGISDFMNFGDRDLDQVFDSFNVFGAGNGMDGEWGDYALDGF